MKEGLVRFYIYFPLPDNLEITTGIINGKVSWNYKYTTQHQSLSFTRRQLVRYHHDLLSRYRDIYRHHPPRHNCTQGIRWEWIPANTRENSRMGWQR